MSIENCQISIFSRLKMTKLSLISFLIIQLTSGENFSEIFQENGQKSSNSNQSEISTNKFESQQDCSGIYFIQHAYTGRFLTGRNVQDSLNQTSYMQRQSTIKGHKGLQMWRIQKHDRFRDRYNITLAFHHDVPLYIGEEYLEPIYQKVPTDISRLWILKPTTSTKWKFGLVDFRQNISEILCLTGPSQGGKIRKVEMSKCSSAEDIDQQWYLINLHWENGRWVCKTLLKNVNSNSCINNNNFYFTIFIPLLILHTYYTHL